ncbi:hypothetical protein EJB05_37010, partial [Eragrostis curvula]
MPKRRKTSNGPSAVASGGADRISALPNKVLQIVLSSLPSDDTVRTSVLARRWRHLWKSVRAIRIHPRRRGGGGGRMWGPWTAPSLRQFVHHLLLLRGGGGGAARRVWTCEGGNNDGSSLLLEGLSGATDLELTSHARVFILRKDCKLCTTFGKLKALAVNEWCLVDDFSALVHFLRYSPILEKLTLRLGHCETRHPAIKKHYDLSPPEHILLSNKLRLVEIKCPTENELVKKLLVALMAYGIQREKINAEPDFAPPELSGYETW